jgi:hypothetical protein
MKVLNRDEIQAVSGALIGGINPYIFSYALLCGVEKISLENTLTQSAAVGGLFSGVLGLAEAMNLANATPLSILLSGIGSSMIGGLMGYVVASVGYEIGNNWKNA